MIFCYLTLGPGTVKFLLKYSKLEFMVPGPNAHIPLTMLICMMNFAGGVFDFIFGLIGGFIILAGLSCLFMPPVEWSLVIEAMVAGMVIGSFPRMIRYFGETVLIRLKGFLAKI